MRSSPVRECILCGNAGTPLHEDLVDRVGRAPGRWSIRRCADGTCRTAWLDPQPVPEQIAEAYRDYYTHDDPVDPEESSPPHRRDARVLRGYLAARYGWQRDVVPAWQRALAPLMYLRPNARAWADFSVLHTPPQPGGASLEVGSGGGRVLSEMQRLGWNVMGVEPDPVTAERTRSMGFDVRQGTLEAQELRADSFDLVSMIHVIEHVHDPVSLLRECLRVLRPGGRLVFVTPNVRALGHSWFGGAWFALEPPRHLLLFSPRSAARAAAEAGFSDVRVQTSIRAATEQFMASNQIRKTGRCVWAKLMSGPRPLWAVALQTLEWLAVTVGLEVGEEIVLVAEKPTR